MWLFQNSWNYYAWNLKKIQAFNCLKFFFTGLKQLKLLQQNADTVDEKSLEGGNLGGNQDYGDIFGDENLFKDFGGFDTD